MNYLMLTILGVTMFTNQQHQIVGKMVDMDTGEIILILPEKLEINKKIVDSREEWGKDKVTSQSFEEFKNLNSTLNSTNQIDNTLNGIDVLSCNADGSCDGKVILDKSTTNNY